MGSQSSFGRGGRRKARISHLPVLGGACSVEARSGSIEVEVETLIEAEKATAKLQ